MTIFDKGHAVIIGVGADLPNTVDDAVGLADILKDPERCAYPAEQVHLLTGEGAARNHVLEALDKLAETTSEDSTVIIFYSGHGYRVESSMGSDYFLMTYGYDINNLKDTTVRDSEFTGKLEKIKAQKFVLLLDCCHAGGLDGSKAPWLTVSKAPLPPQAASLLAQGSGRVAIASSKAHELSYAGVPYSAFTLALIEAFAGKGAASEDGYVRFLDLAQYTLDMVPKRTSNLQNPELNMKDADNFVMAYYAGGDAKAKGLPFSQEPVIEEEPGQMNQARISYQAKLEGSGAIAQGEGATALGAGAVSVGGSVGDSVVTGSRNVLGDKVGGDKISVGDISGSSGIAIGRKASSTVTSYQGESAASIAAAFAELQKTLEASQATVPKKRTAEIALEGLKEEAQKGENPDESTVKEWTDTLLDAVPDMAEVAINTFLNPGLGFATAFRKIIAKAREGRSA